MKYDDIKKTDTDIMTVIYDTLFGFPNFTGFAAAWKLDSTRLP